MRVTNRMMVDRSIRNINASLNRLDKFYNQLASEKQFQYPSDNPVSVAQSMRLNLSIAETEQYIKNADDANDWMASTDTALGQYGTILQRLKELTVSGANSTLPDESRQAIADEVHELRDQIYMLANSEQAGRFLFAGTLTLKNPFTKLPDGTIQYEGNTGDILTELGVGVNMTMNINGERAFGDIFNQLAKLEADLRSNNIDGVNSAIDSIEQVNDHVLQLRAEIGAKINRMDMNKERLESLKLNYQKLLSNVEDLDIAQSVMELKQEEAVQQAALAACARVIQQTLVDFLH
jgi:flagellar hook-associated protein 3 FlgL